MGLTTLLGRRPSASSYAGAVGLTGLLGSVGVWLLDPPLVALANGPAPLLVLVVCLVVGELFPIPVARGDATTSNVTISTTFAVALVALGPLSVVLLAHLVAVFLDDLRGGRRPVQMLFNIGQYSLSLLAARLVYCVTSGTPLLGQQSVLTGADLVPILLAGAVFALANHVLVSVVVALHTGQLVRRSLSRDLRFTLETSAVLVGLAPLTCLVVSHAIWMLPLVLLPIVAVRRSAQMAAQSEGQALRDPLTGLGNRTSLQLRLARGATDGAPGSLAMMLVDLDHFKDVNDNLGHDVGDMLLVEVAARLRAVVPDGAHVARLGGDEFAILVDGGGGDTRELVERAAEDVLQMLGRPVDVGGTRLAVHGSVGVAVAADQQDVPELLKHADIALYEAKEERGRYAVYSPRDGEGEMERLRLLSDLTDAVREGRLSVAYQPQYDCRTGRITVLEALVRWSDPAFAHVPAETLVSLAENSGLIHAVAESVLERSLSDLAAWRAAGHDVSVAVNLSPRQLSDEALPERMRRALARHRVPTSAVVIEVTESSLMIDAKRADLVLESMRALGFLLSIDDFGTGYSSLVRLKDIDVDELKIDRGFVADLTSGRTNDTLVRTIIDLAKNLDLEVVAEGVETAWAAAALSAMGCDRLQGYHLSRPVPAEQVLALLERSEQVEQSVELTLPDTNVPGPRSTPC